MKYTIPFLFIALLALGACGKSAVHDDHHDQDAVGDDDPNEALYNQVNEEHDKVMGRLGELHKLKGQLKEKIAKDESLSAERKKEIDEVTIALDSADRAMFKWMHGWMNNSVDSLDQEKAREYFEGQMEAIKKVGEQMTEAIERAKEEAEKK